MKKYNYRIYGNQIDKGWVNISTVNKKKYIPLVIQDMEEAEIFSQYMIIKHDFQMNCDIPYDIGCFDKSIKKFYNLKR